MNDRPTQDRRRHPRFTADLDVRVLRANHPAGELLDGVLADFSQSGARVLLEQPLPTGERIAFKISHSFDDCITLSASVIWTERTPDGRYQTGCSLSAELTSGQLALIGQLASMQPA